MRIIRRYGFKLLLWSIPIGLALGLILIVASVTFALITGGRHTDSNEASSGEPTPAVALPSPSQQSPNSDSGEGVAMASGCLSRAADPATQLTQTQAAAGPTAVGAAEFAGAWLRWGMTSPIPRYDELLGTTTLNPAEIKALNSGTGPAISATLNGGLYQVTELSPSLATVKVGINWTGTGGQQDYKSGWGTLHLQYGDGVWKVQSIKKADSSFAEFAKDMMPYASGC